MASKKDYYELLGVSRNATDKQIKAAYRKLARKYHPDVNPGDKAAEDKFKEMAEAFAVLSDTEKRATYDRGGHEAFGPGFDPFAGGVDFRTYGFDLSDLLGDLFGGGRGPSRGARGAPRASRGNDLQAEARIAFVDAVMGTTLDLTLPRGTVKARIPAGVEDGTRLRLPGLGNPGSNGGPPGDLYLDVQVEPHPLFRREKRDLMVDVPIGLAKAALGGKVEVPTLDGRSTITIPAGTRSGQKFRLRTRGVPGSSSRPPGDLYAVVQIVPPSTLDARSRELLEEFARLNPAP